RGGARTRKKKKTAKVNGTGAPKASVAALALLGLFLLAAAPGATPEQEVRQGNAAFTQEEYAAAVECYTRAEDGTDDPGLVAYNKAAALYHLAASVDRSRGTAQFREAELHYRRSLEDATGARRAGALYGLGNSLVQQGDAPGTRGLKEAIRCYEQC